MTTVFEAAKTLDRYFMRDMDAYQRRCVRDVLDGIRGLGNPTDQDLEEYLTNAQMEFVRETLRRIKKKIYGPRTRQ